MRWRSRNAPRLKQRRGVADDAEGRDTLGRRQPRHRGIGHAPGDPVEILHAGLVVERHDRDADAPVDGCGPPGAANEDGVRVRG